MEEDGNDEGKGRRPNRDRSVPRSQTSSSGSSTTSSPTESDPKKMRIEKLQDVSELTVAKKMEPQVDSCASLAVLMPDTANVIEHPFSIADQIIIRRTDNADHVLVIGKTGCMLDPLLCPFETDDACKAFRAAGTRFLKAHLQAKHHLVNVRMNLACPCPPWFNKDKRTGKMKSCGTVRYDPYDDIMPHHVADNHNKYYKKMTNALSWMGADDEKKVQKYSDFIIRHGRRDKFPSWTTDLTRPFPSQLIPEEFNIRTTIVDHQLRYMCNISPCQSELFKRSMAVETHMRTQHSRQLGSETELYHACPLYPKDCPVKLVAMYEQLEAHVSAVHPDLLGKHYTDEAKQKRAFLVSEIEGATVGEAISNVVQTDEGTVETAPKYLETYYCPVPNCEKYYHVLDFTIWHITTDHEELWNSS